MRKMIMILAVATFGFVACNETPEGSSTTDSTTVSVDTAAIAPVDTVINVDTLAPAVPDTATVK